MNAFQFLSGSTADALGWTLLHAIWQGFALVVPIAFLLHLLRNRSSALRYRVGVLTLLTQLILSAATFIWHYKPVTILPLRPIITVSQAMPLHWQMIAQPFSWHQQAQQFLQAHLSQFVLIYLIGVSLFGVRLAGGWLYLQRVSQTASRPATTFWTHLTDNIRAAMALRTVVQIRESVQITGPMVVGVLKPILLLPVGLATHLTTREIEAILAHELAHIKRYDYAVNLLQSIVEVLYFFHPALWWLSARVREEREHCCDDLAVQVCGGDGHIVAQALAHVEELRLIQFNQTPALAMAFVSKRQQLLHRVRRMLGVPTRPFVSNSSLIGLTVATILVMSVSVYAMQQEKPKPHAIQPRPSHATRRHNKGNGTEYGMIDNKKVDYVIWKGKKLPASRVVRLQRQFDQVMAGNLSLDNVAQPDRDILLTIIETNQSFDNGMNSLAEGLSHIDYNTIMKTGFDAANAAGTFPVNVDDVLKQVEKIDYNSLIGNAMASASNLTISNDSLDKQRAYHQRQMDSLSQLLTQRSRQVEAIHLQMEKLQFPIEELERNQEVLSWRKAKFMEQRNALIEKHQRLLASDGKQKLNQADVEKQVAAIEPEIKKLEENIIEWNKKVDELTVKQDEVKLPMDKLKRESEQLDQQIEKLSEEIGKHGDGLSHMMSDLSNLGVNVNVNTHLNRLNRLVNPPRPPRPARVPNAVRPAVPAVPVRPHIAPAAPVSPRPKIAPAPKPKPAPKPVKAE